MSDDSSGFISPHITIIVIKSKSLSAAFVCDLLRKNFTLERRKVEEAAARRTSLTESSRVNSNFCYIKRQRGPVFARKCARSSGHFESLRASRTKYCRRLSRFWYAMLFSSSTCPPPSLLSSRLNFSFLIHFTLSQLHSAERVQALI